MYRVDISPDAKQILSTYVDLCMEILAAFVVRISDY